MAAKVKIPVTRRALIQRISRALLKQSEQLKSARSEGVRQRVGDYYVVDLQRNAIVAQHVDLEILGRELGVLEPYEGLAD